MMICEHLFHKKLYSTNRLHFPCLSVHCNQMTGDVGACKELKMQHETKSSGKTVILHPMCEEHYSTVQYTNRGKCNPLILYNKIQMVYSNIWGDLGKKTC